MPRRGLAALLITTGALILLLSFKTPDATLPTRASDAAIVAPRGSASTVRPAATPAPADSTTGAAGPTAAPGAASAAPGAASNGTVDGPVVSTRYGDIQVEIVVDGGQVQDVVALELPTGRRSGQISQYAAPILRSEALQAKSANIDTVSGATYTSQAYAKSLQGALDQAGIG
jgi:uncharacterized protein with FMN-binding domain